MNRLDWIACSTCRTIVSLLASHDGRCVACALVHARREAAETMRARCARIAEERCEAAAQRNDDYPSDYRRGIREGSRVIATSIHALEVTP